jgi:hypothetical protein
VVLTAQRGEVPPELQAQLDSSGWRPWYTPDPLAAMAGLCVLHRAASSRSGLGLGTTSLSLVVVEPQPAGTTQDLFSAARRFLPGARLWVFARGALHQAGGGEPGQPPDRREPPAITREEIQMLLESETGSP